LLQMLENKSMAKDAGQVQKKEEDGGDLDSFLKSSDKQILPAVVNFMEKLQQQLHRAL